jgi:hypothetical protein
MTDDVVRLAHQLRFCEARGFDELVVEIGQPPLVSVLETIRVSSVMGYSIAVTGRLVRIAVLLERMGLQS